MLETKDLQAIRGILKEELAETKDELRAEFKQELSAAKDELRQEIAATKDELRQEIAATKDELRQEISTAKDELRTELRTEFRHELTESENMILEYVERVHDDFNERFSVLQESMNELKRQMNAVRLSQDSIDYLLKRTKSLDQRVSRLETRMA
ncbi:MAG: hypothetical protein PUF13_07405 [Lachnospiraceae bacterium]|nr:hypothetical protein [Lachnospiraceae bacterium]